jgi:hypothetical protein
MSKTAEQLEAMQIWARFVEDMEPCIQILMKTGMRRSEAWLVVGLEGIRTALIDTDSDKKAQIAILDSAIKDFYGN